MKRELEIQVPLFNLLVKDVMDIVISYTNPVDKVVISCVSKLFNTLIQKYTVYGGYWISDTKLKIEKRNISTINKHKDYSKSMVNRDSLLLTSLYHGYYGLLPWIVDQIDLSYVTSVEKHLCLTYMIEDNRLDLIDDFCKTFSIPLDYYNNEYKDDVMYASVHSGNLNTVKHFFNIIDKPYYYDVPSLHQYYIAIRHGYVDIIRFFYNECQSSLPKNMLKYAIKNGDLDLIKWLLGFSNNKYEPPLHNEIYDWKKEYNKHLQVKTIILAIKKGRIDIIKFLIDVVHCPYKSEYVICTSLRFNQLDILEYFLTVNRIQSIDIKQHLTNENDYNLTIESLVVQGFLHILEYLNEKHDYQPDEFLCRCAIHSSNLEILQWAIKKNAKVSSDCLKLAIKHREMDIIKCLLDTGYDFKFDEKSKNDIIKGIRKYDAIMKLLKEKLGCLFD